MTKRCIWALAIVLALAVPAHGQSWTAPLTWITGRQVTAVDLNAQIRDNELVLRAGGLSVSSQTVGDLLCASSSSQFGRLADVATGSVLVSGGTGSCPSWSTNVPLLNAANTFVASSANIFTGTAGSGTGGGLLRVQRNASPGTYMEIFGGSSLEDPYINVPSGFGIPFRVNGLEVGRINSVGVLSINGFGTHNFSASGTGTNALQVRNPTAGTGNLAKLVAFADLNAVTLAMNSSTYTTGTFDRQDGAFLQTGGAGGLSVVSSAAPIYVYANSSSQLTAEFELGGSGFPVLLLQGGAFGTGGNLGAEIILQPNSSGGGAPGLLNLISKNGNNGFIWVDSAGVVRVESSGISFPSVANGDTGGTIVGTQTSTLDSKLLIEPFTDTRHALDVVANAPLWRFTYKHGVAGEFMGVLSNTTPEVMMDPSPEHPEGRSFSPVSAFGYSAAAIAELRKEIDALRRPYQFTFLPSEVR